MKNLDQFLNLFYELSTPDESIEDVDEDSPPPRDFSQYGEWTPCARIHSEDYVTGAWLIGRTRPFSRSILSARYNIYHEPSNTLFGSSGTLKLAKRIVDHMQSNFFSESGELVDESGLALYVQDQHNEGMLL